MDDNSEQQLLENIKDCQKTARNLLKENESILLQKQKSTDTSSNSDHSVKQPPLVDDVNKQLMESTQQQQQLKLSLKQYLITQSALPTSADRSTIQNDNFVANVLINQQVKPFDDDNAQNEANLNPTVQALFSGTLPDEFFLHLMSFMGIHECLASNRQVCSLWNELILDRCRNQKSLKLFENFESLMKYGELLLKYEKTDDTSLLLKSVGDELFFEPLETDHEQLVNSLHQDDNSDEDYSEGDTEEDDLLFQRLESDCEQFVHSLHQEEFDEEATEEEATDEEGFEEMPNPDDDLTALFPNVEELVLCPEQNTLINIEHLLEFYAEQLTSLTVTRFGPWQERPASILGAFNFPNLKSLNTFHFSPQDDQLLSLLPQLESLTMQSANMSLETLLRTGTQIGELNIDYIRVLYTEPEAESSKRPPINSNLRKFTFGSTEEVLKALEFISLNLTSLECLKMNFNYFEDNLHSLTSHLLPLTQLHSLTLTASLPFFLLDDTQLAEIQPLPSVRQLKLLLSACDSLSLERFSKSLFAVFPNVAQVLIAFVSGVDTATFEAFASKHPTVVQLFRSKDMSKFTTFPNAVAPLLGHHRQRYEEYIEEEELFGVPICKLTAALVLQEGENVPDLKITLRPSDRLTAMSNLLQLLESKAFAFTFDMVNKMVRRMVHCALKYGPSQGALFSVTSKCVLFLLDRRAVNGSQEKPFLGTEGVEAFPFLEMMLDLLEHSQMQQFDDQSLPFQMYLFMVKILKGEFDSSSDDTGDLDEYGRFKILLKLADFYQTQQLSVLDSEEELLLQLNNLIDDQLQKFELEERLGTATSQLIESKNRVYRVEMARALLRCCESTDFKWLGDEADSSDSTSDGSSSRRTKNCFRSF